jgi:hypothetical protein
VQDDHAAAGAVKVRAGSWNVGMCSDSGATLTFDNSGQGSG